MALSIGMVTVDSTDPRPLAQWWARQLGGRVVDESDGWFLEVVPADGVSAPVLGFQRVEDPTPGKNRLHLDLGTSDREADVAALVADGATFVAEHTMPGFRWAVLADPQGNQFCVGAADGAATTLG
ncbi:glyoxalase [Cellulosimicrobium funkei]|uniref:Glyoxalase n=1 Tax=Cellulosimicrobium funkei TaxID=264251 RepID=A0A0H2L3A7_9MICO|nr:VOC family protein [Cellulosimicrobium funkei]KLN34617.1 glyoxalase [Cellulosimicrobium funkei]